MFVESSIGTGTWYSAQQTLLLEMLENSLLFSVKLSPKKFYLCTPTVHTTTINSILTLSI